MEDDDYRATPDDWAMLTAQAKKLLASEKEGYRLRLEGHELDQRTKMLRRQLAEREDIPAELQAVWTETDNIKRQSKAFWLRVILDDYEY